MNWLAHLFLAEEPLRCRLGNLLADVIKGPARRTVDALLQRGLDCHRVIDRFTDSHPLFIHSSNQLSDRWARFRGIVMDIYYDHLLARSWSRFSNEPLPQFVRDFYAKATHSVQTLPSFAGEVLQSIIHVDRLGSYATLAGIEDALTKLSARITERVGQVIRLQDAMPELIKLDAILENDFKQFFPELIAHVKAWSESRPSLELAEVSPATSA
jgi:acyl carrier protein phosphodiesterase